MRRAMVLCLTLVSIAGCQKVYPEVFDSPEMKAAIVQAIKESNKTWNVGASVHNPELEAAYKISLSVRVIGVDGEIGSQGAAGPEGLTQDFREIRERIDAMQRAYAKLAGIPPDVN